MSSRVQKIRKNIENKQKLDLYTLYNSLVGSCIVTIGKLAKKTEEDLVKDFDMFSDNTNPLWNCKTIKEVCDYLIKFYDVSDDYKENIVLVYDEDNVYTPIVTLEIDDTILPLDPNGMTLGILNHLDKATMEYIYDEETEDNIEC